MSYYINHDIFICDIIIPSNDAQAGNIVFGSVMMSKVMNGHWFLWAHVNTTIYFSFGMPVWYQKMSKHNLISVTGVSCTLKCMFTTCFEAITFMTPSIGEKSIVIKYKIESSRALTRRLLVCLNSFNCFLFTKYLWCVADIKWWSNWNCKASCT